MRKLIPKDIKDTTSAPESFFLQFSEGKELTEENRIFIINNAVHSVGVQDKYNFYPLVGILLGFLGFNCRVTRDGDTNNRADAIIIDDKFSIPIEIKSPTEVAYINIKSIRQAVENKVVLLSRKFYPTEFSTSTLAIGYEYPAERSDIFELIDNIFLSYQINVGIISIEDLFESVWDVIINKSTFDKLRISSLKGVFK